MDNTRKAGTKVNRTDAQQVKPRNPRPTIGLLTYGVGDPNNQSLWSGVEDVVQQQGTNLVCFPGNPIQSSQGFESQANVLYDLVSPEEIDGLVIWSGALAHHIGVEEIDSFCKRYRPLPMVSIAQALEGIPSVLADNYQGMYDPVHHLIKVHGYRRIAFVQGPAGHQEAEMRYQAYVDALAEHELTVDPGLVVPGAFTKQSGITAMNLLLDERGLSPQKDFEAVVADGDITALGVLEALKARGVRVPEDVALVGFDDIPAARLATPPLTTARYSFYDQGRRAAEILLAQIEGQEVPERTELPIKLIVRQSCGCMPPAVVQAAVGPTAEADKNETFEDLADKDHPYAGQRERILSEMVEAIGNPSTNASSAWAEQLLDAFSSELTGQSAGAFLSTLTDILHQATTETREVIIWQEAISVLRRHTLPSLSDNRIQSQAEDLWQQARVVIGERAWRAQAYHGLQIEQQSQALQEINQTLTTTIDMAGLTDVVASELPKLGVTRGFISLYEDPQAPAERARLVLAYDEHGRTDLGTFESIFPSHQLVPHGLLPSDRAYGLVVEPLYFRQEQLGFAVFEAGSQEERICATIRGQLSSALKGVLLLQERRRAEKALEKAYAEVEKRVEERTAELKRETAERERLQQEVIEAQRHAIQELATPIIPVMDRIIVMPLIGSIDTLRARDITRSLLAGIREHRAKVVILDITGVPVVDSGVAGHLNKTVQAARLKGARTIVTGISDAVAETIVDLGIDWSGIETLSDLQTGLITALDSLGIKLSR